MRWNNLTGIVTPVEHQPERQFSPAVSNLFLDALSGQTGPRDGAGEALRANDLGAQKRDSRTAA